MILRGNHREVLFGSEHDRALLNQIVAEAINRFGARIHAFCWMSNHLHALVQIGERPLGLLMQRIAMRYSRHRHKSLNTTGHLFERRYRAKLVDVDEYFLTLLRYVHLNPVKARIVRDPAEYPWSSHRAYLGMESILWLTTDFGLSLFSNRLDQARDAYAQFVLQGDDMDDPGQGSHPDDPRILGSDDFINKLPLPRYRPRSPLTLEQLATSTAEAHNISVELLRSRSRARTLTPIRIELTRRAIELRIATLSEVARFLLREPSALSQLLARHAAADQNLQK